MALQNLFLVTFGSDWGVVSLALSYDDVSLVLQGLDYVNPSPRPGTLTLSGPLNRVIIAPPNETRTVDLTPANVVCVQSTVTNRFGTFVSTALPGAEQVQFVWPT